MKKTIMFVSVFAFAFAISASVALAGPCCGGSGVDVDNHNCAIVDNNVSSGASTGNNVGGTVISGSATSQASAVTYANNNTTTVSGIRANVSNNNGMFVGNDVNSSAYTGGNKGWSITSGNATSKAYGETYGNSNTTTVSSVPFMRGVNVTNGNAAFVHNNVNSYAGTGDNKTCLGCWGCGSVKTGNANSLASAFSNINSNVTTIGGK